MRSLAIGLSIICVASFGCGDSGGTSKPPGGDVRGDSGAEAAAKSDVGTPSDRPADQPIMSSDGPAGGAETSMDAVSQGDGGSCGTLGAACCANNACTQGVCVAGSCRDCGMLGAPCCA